jgi:hypothetical protein
MAARSCASEVRTCAREETKFEIKFKTKRESVFEEAFVRTRPQIQDQRSDLLLPGKRTALSFVGGVDRAGWDWVGWG